MADESKPWLEGIEGEHVKRLIESDARAIQTVAGPGSGKSTGLKRRVWRLIRGDGVAARKIFAGTFTRAIAADLTASSSRAVPGDNPEKPVISTLHSHALQMLREKRTVAPGREFRFLLAHEEEAMLYDIGAAVPISATSMRAEQNCERCRLSGLTQLRLTMNDLKVPLKRG
jgi:superfamily I DNA/RNA helicase